MMTHPTPLQRIAFIAALAMMGTAASATAWSISYAMTSKARYDYRVIAADGKVVLFIETMPFPLTPEEAVSLSDILKRQAVALEPKSFDSIAEEVAKDTDEYFCGKSRTEWERGAFCTGLRRSVRIDKVAPFSGYARRCGNTVYISVPFYSDSGAERFLDQFSGDDK